MDAVMMQIIQGIVDEMRRCVLNMRLVISRLITSKGEQPRRSH